MSTTDHTPARAVKEPRVTSAGGYRAELHGLRALAIMMVAVYHIWFGRVSGGIDIFLLLSSFLLMQTFSRRIERGNLDIIQYWLKAFRRLVPPAVITILGTLGLMLLFFPESRWREILRQSFASSLYYENWYLALNSQDYFADKLTISPLQHFWSLSMQGQIFIVWPAIIAICFGFGKLIGTKPYVGLGIIFTTIFGVSLTWSIIETSTNQSFAYFSTFTRLWEFALGALLALFLPLVEKRLGYGPIREHTCPKPLVIVRIIVGWLAVIAILSVGFVVDVQGAFPGYIALWPTGAAVLVILAGNTHSRWGVDAILSARPFQFLGDISYALYLVHWSFLITTMMVFGTSQLDLGQGAFVLICSLLAATLLTEKVDAPIRHSVWAEAKKYRSVLIIVVGLVVGMVPGLAGVAALDYQMVQAQREAARNNPGARVLYDTQLPEPDPDALPLPLEADVPEDWFSLGVECVDGLDEKYMPPDYFLIGMPKGLRGNCETAIDEPGPKRVLIVGDSRMEQQAASLPDLAQKFGWSMYSILRGGCAFRVGTPAAPGEAGYDDQGNPLAAGEQSEAWCQQWNEKLLDYILDVRPDIVVLTATSISSAGGEKMLSDIDETIATMTAAGIDVIAFRDTPRFGEHPWACIDQLGPEACAVPRYRVYPRTSIMSSLTNAVQGPGKVYLIDLSDYICPDDECPMIIGNVYVHMDERHITAQYAASMSGAVDAQLTEQGYR